MSNELPNTPSASEPERPAKVSKKDLHLNNDGSPTSPFTLDPAIPSTAPPQLSLDGSTTSDSPGQASRILEGIKQAAAVLRKGAITVAEFTKSVAVATWAETRRQREMIILKRRLRGIEDAQFKMERDIGARLFASGSVPRNEEEMDVRFGQLNQSYILANQAGQAGDKIKKAEAVRLATELQTLYVNCGRLAINQTRNKEFNFEGDNEALTQSNRLQSDVTTTTGQILQLEELWKATPSKAKREVYLGVTACVVLICVMFIWVFAPRQPALPRGTEVASDPSSSENVRNQPDELRGAIHSGKTDTLALPEPIKGMEPRELVSPASGRDAKNPPKLATPKDRAAVLKETFVLLHNDNVTSVAFSPDGKILASGGWDKVIRLWDAATGQEKTKLKGHTNPVQAIAFSPGGKTLATGAEDDRVVRLWDVTTAREIAQLEGHTDGICSVAFSPDGKTLASGSDDDSVRLWDLTTGQEKAKLQRYKYVVFSPDGKTIAFSRRHRFDGLLLWDGSTDKKQELKGHNGEGGGVMSMAFSPDGKTLASGGSDNTIRLWNVATGKETAKLDGHTGGFGGGVPSVAFSPDGKTIASGGWDKTVRLWDVTTGKETAKLEGHTDGVMSVSFSPDGKTLASGGFDKSVRLWGLMRGGDQNGELTHSFMPHKVGTYAQYCNEMHLPNGETMALMRMQKMLEDGAVVINTHSIGVLDAAHPLPDGFYGTTGKNRFKLITPMNTTTTEFRRVRAGFIEEGHTQDNGKEKEIVWSPVLKLGAKKGDEWEATPLVVPLNDRMKSDGVPIEGMRLKYSVRQFDRHKLQGEAEARETVGVQAVVVINRVPTSSSLTIYLSGIGPLHTRRYMLKDEKLILASETFLVDNSSNRFLQKVDLQFFAPSDNDFIQRSVTLPKKAK